MSKHKLIKIFTPILLGLSILAHPASAYAADYRDAGVLTHEQGTYIYTSKKYDGVNTNLITKAASMFLYHIQVL